MITAGSSEADEEGADLAAAVELDRNPVLIDGSGASVVGLLIRAG